MPIIQPYCRDDLASVVCYVVAYDEHMADVGDRAKEVVGLVLSV